MRGSAAFLVLLLAYVRAQGGPIVNTTTGQVQGVNVAMASGDVIQTWMGIPFAKAPYGDLRFEPPQPVEPWDDVFDASSLGKVCMQASYAGDPTWDMYVNDEDCLHLNVYSKQRTETNPLPVMVWIHGGGFNGGTNFEYPGYFFAEKDVVFVALNYRLGMFGWAYTADGILNGNQGLWDNIMALQWIQDNIAGFGGDPGRVIVFGQSSGGSNTGILQLAPQAEGLFHGAILESGAGIAPWSVMLEKFGAETYMYQMAAKFGCDTSSMQVIVDCMREQDAQEIADQDYVDCPEGSTACQGFQPVVDGVLIPDVPILMRERGEFHKMPEMLGLTEEDGFGWGSWTIWDGLTREEIEGWWQTLAVWCAVLWPEPAVVQDVVQATNWFYAAWPELEDQDVNRAMMGYFLTDYWYGASADYQAKTASVAGQPAYFYVYKYMLENSYPNDWDGTPHSAEISPLFGYPLLLDNPQALVHSQFPPSYLTGQLYTQRDKDYSDFLCTLWTNFAKYWDPTPEPIGPAGGPQISWTGYQVGNLTYAYLDVAPYTAIDYRQKEYAYHNRYLNYMIYGKEFYLEDYEKRN